MRNSELYELYRNYNPNDDYSGAFGMNIINLIIKRAGGLEKIDKWLMIQRCKKLEREALDENYTHQ